MSRLCDYVLEVLNTVCQENNQCATWEKLTQQYKQLRSNAAVSSDPSMSDKYERLVLFLEIYGGIIRKHFVRTIFRSCDPRQLSRMMAFGSNNLTSDYDATILGRDAPGIVDCMMRSFFNKYKTTMSIMFDTNLYCVGFLDARGIQNTGRVKIIGGDMAVVRATTRQEEDVCLTFALLKLLPFLESEWMADHPRIVALLKNLKNHLDGNCAVVRQATRIEKIMRSYELQTAFARKVNAVLYDNNNADAAQFMHNVCASQYFSIESYYTPQTVLVVVLYMQGKKISPDQIEPFAFLCSVFENMGDLYQHTASNFQMNDTAGVSAVIIQVSKYIYRIYHSLFSWTGSRQYDQKSRQAQTIVALRGGQAASSPVNLSRIGYTPGMTLGDYITGFLRSILPLVLQRIDAIGEARLPPSQSIPGVGRQQQQKKNDATTQSPPRQQQKKTTQSPSLGLNGQQKKTTQSPSLGVNGQQLRKNNATRQPPSRQQQQKKNISTTAQTISPNSMASFGTALL